VSKTIPIVINNFNRITTTRKLVEDLEARGYHNLYILDNNSSYAPLLEWYSTLGGRVDVRRFSNNYAQNAIFDCGILSEFQGKFDWIVYTDSDIELNPITPYDFVDRLIELTIKWGYKKGGLALKIDDLPDNDYGLTNRNWEARFWTTPLEEDVYAAQLDTTFCVWNPSTGLLYDAIRVAGPFTAKHVPWYVDFNNLDEEERTFLENSHEYSTYARFYRKYIKPTV
jgi:hypothetical protein